MRNVTLVLLNGVLFQGFYTADTYIFFISETKSTFIYHYLFLKKINNLFLKLCKYATSICINLENTNPLMLLFHFKIPFEANILLKWKFNIQRRGCSMMCFYTALLQMTIFNTKYLLEYVTSLSGLFHFAFSAE